MEIRPLTRDNVQRIRRLYDASRKAETDFHDSLAMLIGRHILHRTHTSAVWLEVKGYAHGRLYCYNSRTKVHRWVYYSPEVEVE